MSSRRRFKDAESNGDSAWSSWTKSPSSDSSSSPIGFSSETGSCAAQDLAYLLGHDLELLGDLVRRRLAPEPLDELPLDMDDLVELLDHMDGNPDRARLVGDGARHGLADPPGRVRRELESLAVIELLDRADEAERAFLDEIEEGEPAGRDSR